MRRRLRFLLTRMAAVISVKLFLLYDQLDGCSYCPHEQGRFWHENCNGGVSGVLRMDCRLSPKCEHRAASVFCSVALSCLLSLAVSQCYLPHSRSC